MIEKETCMAAWKKALSDILDGGEDFEDENNRICRELFNLKIIVKNPSKELTYPIEVLNGFKQWKYPPLEEMKKVILKIK